ncbi:MAG: hypothetical protein K2X91_13060, partial [Thermoleophilia bacterium]|nr:hypothetical protein [Thermoleophilia bacterium]
AAAPVAEPAAPGRRLVAARTAIPVAMALGVRLAREAGGSAAAGLFLTFPATSLALLWTTHLESGPASARRLARALPAGALGMGAFLATFLTTAATLGTASATALGYVAAAAALGAAEILGSTRPTPLRRLAALGRLARRKLAAAWPEPVGAPLPLAGPRLLRSPRRTPRFAPRCEMLAG